MGDTQRAEQSARCFCLQTLLMLNRSCIISSSPAESCIIASQARGMRWPCLSQSKQADSARITNVTYVLTTNETHRPLPARFQYEPSVILTRVFKQLFGNESHEPVGMKTSSRSISS